MPDAEDTAAETEQEEEAAEPGPSATVERTGPYECVIRIQADADYLRDRYQEDLASLQTEVTLPGFRQGHAPVGLVERKMGSALRSDVISSVVAEAYDKAVEDHDLTVVAETDAPDLENFTWEPGQPAEFEFKLEVMPEVELEEKHYKGLEVDAPALEVTDELLQREMERFAQQFATWEEVTGAGIDWDDYVEAEVSAPDVDWSETIGFYPRAERIGPFSAEGIKAALVGAKVGDDVEVEAELPEDQVGGREQLASLAGQNTMLKLALSHVTRRKVPELDDELAEKIGLSSAEEIEPIVRERLANALEQRKGEIVRQVAVEAALEA
ncbi:MAG: trigger factor, partial [Planctomycetota bacterium]